MGGGTSSSMRKYLGSIKDTTTISLAKVNSDNKKLDIAVVRATNHVERPAKEKHIRAIFAVVSANRHRPDVAYCIHALSRRLSKTHNWAVALKTLIVIHRALREVDATFRDELINYGRRRSHMLNMSHFKDDSSANAWDYSSWVRAYALFLEQKLECFRLLKYEVETEPAKIKDVDTTILLEQLPALQQLLFRVLGCQPEGAAVHNHVIQLALSMVATESIKIYNAISDGSVNLVDKFFEMQRNDATWALDIYRRAGQQAERLAEFYEVCKSLDFGRGDKFIKIEQAPASFLQTMEDYVSEAPRESTFLKEQVKLVVDEKPTMDLTIEDKEVTDVKVEKISPPPPPEPVKEKKPVIEVPDLLSFDDPPFASDLDDKNTMSLAILPIDDLSTTNTTTATQAPSLANVTTGWELALVTTPLSNVTTTAAAPQLAGVIDNVTLDSLYDNAIKRSNQPASYNPWEPSPFTNPMMQPLVHNPFMASNGLVSVAPHSMQMSTMSNQRQAFMFEQAMMMMDPQQHQLQQPPALAPAVTNPFSSPNYAPSMPVQTYNPYATGF